VKLIRLAGASFQEHIPYHNIENDRVGTDGTKTSISMEEEHLVFVNYLFMLPLLEMLSLIIQCCLDRPDYNDAHASLSRRFRARQRTYFELSYLKTGGLGLSWNSDFILVNGSYSYSKFTLFFIGNKKWRRDCFYLDWFGVYNYIDWDVDFDLVSHWTPKGVGRAQMVNWFFNWKRQEDCMGAP